MDSHENAIKNIQQNSVSKHELIIPLDIYKAMSSSSSDAVECVCFKKASSVDTVEAFLFLCEMSKHYFNIILREITNEISIKEYTLPIKSYLYYDDNVKLQQIKASFIAPNATLRAGKCKNDEILINTQYRRDTNTWNEYTFPTLLSFVDDVNDKWTLYKKYGDTANSFKSDYELILSYI